MHCEGEGQRSHGLSGENTFTCVQMSITCGMLTYTSLPLRCDTLVCVWYDAHVLPRVFCAGNRCCSWRGKCRCKRATCATRRTA